MTSDNHEAAKAAHTRIQAAIDQLVEEIADCEDFEKLVQYSANLDQLDTGLIRLKEIMHRLGPVNAVI